MKTINLFRSKKMWLIAGAALLSTTFLAQASGTIKGRVLDTNNQPVEYATATLNDPETNQIVNGDMCDKNGEYVLENVKPGIYILSIRIIGYEKSESQLIIVDSDKNTTEKQPIVLNESINLLPELEVIGKARETAANKLASAKTNS